MWPLGVIMYEMLMGEWGCVATGGHHVGDVDG